MKALADRNRLRIINMLLASRWRGGLRLRVRAAPRPFSGDHQQASEGAGGRGPDRAGERGSRSDFSLVPGALDSVREVFAPATAWIPGPTSCVAPRPRPGCGDKCPYIPGKRYIDWEPPDPKGQPLDVVRSTREGIPRRVEALVQALDGD